MFALLDFTELPKDGEALELLVREMVLMLGYRARWSGRGPDSGRDLILEEPGDPALGSKIRKWIISCKHTAHADRGNGRSVNGEDIGTDGGIIDTLAQHQGDGYLLVCSTQPSSSLVNRLEQIERNRGIHTYIWDGVELERMLATPKGWSIAQRFMPQSTASWKIFATDKPNQFVGITRGYYIHIENRADSKLGFRLSAIDARLNVAEKVKLPEGHQLRPRGVFFNEKRASVHLYFDYLYKTDALGIHGRIEEPPFSEESLADWLNSQSRQSAECDEDGQDSDFTISMRPLRTAGDNDDPDHYRYYEAFRNWMEWYSRDGNTGFR